MTDNLTDLTEWLRSCPHTPLRDPNSDLFTGQLCDNSSCLREREAADTIEAQQAQIDRLRDTLAELVEWLDRTDRKGCAHTEHARTVLKAGR